MKERVKGNIRPTLVFLLGLFERMLLLVDLLEDFRKVVLKDTEQLRELIPEAIGFFSQNLGFLTIFLIGISY